ncbi:MAG: hypothetical protein Q4D81_08785 [Eubacteriales bacterium]|nr:hypothetical protein [Eubacteriales bacterium]
MKKIIALFMAAVIICLSTACSGQGSGSTQSSAPAVDSKESKAAEGDAAAQTAAPEAASAENTAQEGAVPEAASTGSTGQEASVPVNRDAGTGTGFYENENGWMVWYEPEKVVVQENNKDDVLFLYTGEAVGENFVEICFIPDAQPQEVLTAELEQLSEEEDLDLEEIIRDEGYFFEDKWGFIATAMYSDDEREVTASFQSAEYNGGVILTRLVDGMTDESILEGFMDDTLWQILDSISFYHYEPQTEYAYVPGTYSRPGSEGDKEDRIILKDNHTGYLEFQDRIPITWGSCRITRQNSEEAYEYTIEGDSLYLKEIDSSPKGTANDQTESDPNEAENDQTESDPNETTHEQTANNQTENDPGEEGDGEWIEFKKTAEPDEALEKNPLLDQDYVDELNKEINLLYHDGGGETGRIHKMQAFVLELALHAKTRNPDFQVITQNSVFLAYNDGKMEKGEQSFIKDLVDGYGVEGIVGKGTSLTPDLFQKMYVDQAKRGKFVSDTTTVQSEEELENYLARANAWGIAPFPKIGGELAQELLPGKRWANNGDYFWVEDPETLGISDRFDGSRNVEKVADAKNYLYNINSRPYDNWEDWDDEEAEFEKGDGDRTRITDSYACGLLVPSEGGKYVPVGENPEDEMVAESIEEYGDQWDWWWRAEGLDENAGRETWLETLRNSDYDVIYIDSFYNHRARPEDQTPLTKEEVESLKYKPDGGRRQVIAYLSIGSAEQNRWYCQDDWIWVDPKNLDSFYSMKCGKIIERGTGTTYIPFRESSDAKRTEDTTDLPVWLAFGYGDEYPEEAVVEWWHEDWRNIIINGGGKYAHKETGDNTSSIDRILDQGFDGVYLDNTDACKDPYWTAFDEYWNNHGGIPTAD